MCKSSLTSHLAFSMLGSPVMWTRHFYNMDVQLHAFQTKREEFQNSAQLFLKWHLNVPCFWTYIHSHTRRWLTFPGGQKAFLHSTWLVLIFPQCHRWEQTHWLLFCLTFFVHKPFPWKSVLLLQCMYVGDSFLICVLQNRNEKLLLIFTHCKFPAASLLSSLLEVNEA